MAAEGMYTGQFVYCRKKANLMVGNVLPLASIPEGAVCKVEHHVGDRGVFARASGDYAIVIMGLPGICDFFFASQVPVPQANREKKEKKNKRQAGCMYDKKC